MTHFLSIQIITNQWVKLRILKVSTISIMISISKLISTVHWKIHTTTIRFHKLILNLIIIIMYLLSNNKPKTIKNIIYLVKLHLKRRLTNILKMLKDKISIYLTPNGTISTNHTPLNLMLKLILTNQPNQILLSPEREKIKNTLMICQ